MKQTTQDAALVQEYYCKWSKGTERRDYTPSSRCGECAATGTPEACRCLIESGENLIQRFSSVSQPVQLPRMEIPRAKNTMWNFYCKLQCVAFSAANLPNESVRTLISLHQFHDIQIEDPSFYWFAMIFKVMCAGYKTQRVKSVWFLCDSPKIHSCFQVTARKMPKEQSNISAWFLLSFCEGVVFTFESFWWDRSRAHQAVQGVQIFDTLVKHFIQVCHRRVALERFVIPRPCHHSQTAATGAALTIWSVEKSVVPLLWDSRALNHVFHII